MRAVLLGMNNPLSTKPEHALYPFPPGCTGHRLWKLLQSRRAEITQECYLRGFDRRNLVSGEWSRRRAEQGVRELRTWLHTQPAGRTVVVLGREPARALGLEPLLIEPVTIDGTTWRQLPHPSGRCRWYNEPGNAALAALLLDELYDGAP